MVPEVIRKQIETHINDFTIPLIVNKEGCDVRRHFEDIGKLVGTGTLAQLGQRKGILTAHHVVTKGLSSDAENHLFTTTSVTQPEKRLLGKCEVFACITPQEPLSEKTGPDIAFLEFPHGSELAETFLSRGKCFYELGKSIEQRIAGLSGEYISMFVGYPIDFNPEPSSDLQSSKNIKRLTCGAFMTVENAPITTPEGYDVIDLPSDRDYEPRAPRSYGGVSGGGLWRAMVTPDRKSVDAYVLVGVAFYQFSEDRGQRMIRCYGPISLYKKLVPLLSQ
jgi:hypothetical protein